MGSPESPLRPVLTDSDISDFNAIAAFLARRDVPKLSIPALDGKIDLIVLAGSSVLASVEIAAAAFRDGVSERILVTGGIGHSTPLLRGAVASDPEFAKIRIEGRSEAEIFRDVLIFRHGIPERAIWVESESTNCAANAWASKDLLARLGISLTGAILIQDPTMQSRTHASFLRAWRGEPPATFLSFAPFVPAVVSGVAVSPPAWPFSRFLSLVMGEIPRLHDIPGGYGPAGRDFIEHVDIPDFVLAAHARLRNRIPAFDRPIPR
ncbi:MAG TPA: YdcF family protein [Fimbriimonadaceae bacterium]|nr:YdcF family protein [Fimbriimonadaceae bacterium]